jgi:DNA segregation ATPase FtsK/SpoIIIE-like protein
MSSQLSTRRVRELLVGLRRLIAERARSEAEIKSKFEARTTAERVAGERDAGRIESAARAARTAAEQEYQQTRDHILRTTEERLRAAKGEFGRVREDTLDRYQAEDEAIRHEHQEARWAHEGVHEATAKQAQGERHQTLRALGEQELKVKELRESVREVLEDWKLVPQAADDPAPELPPTEVVAVIEGQIAEARHHLSQLRGLVAPRLLVGDRLLWIALGTWIAVALSGFLFLSPWYLGPVIATVVAVLGTLGLRYALAARTQSQSARICQPLFRALAEADRLLSKSVRAADESCARVIADSERRCKDEVRKADKEHRSQLAAALQRRDRAMQSAEKTQDDAVSTLSTARDSELARIEKEYRQRTTDLEQGHEREASGLAQRRDREQAESLKEYSRAFRELSETWSHGTVAARAEIEAISRDNSRLFPDWHSPAWRDWQLAADVPGGIRFGTLAVDTARFPGSAPAKGADGAESGPQLKPFEPATFQVPALLPFPHRCATVLRTADAGRAAGVQALQAMMARFLTAVPPGKVRFTVVDPVGLGENFAAFMHLADHDERLVGSHIWVETPHIEKQLADLTAHMQNVIQKYLRNQYASLEEYNEKAGEVAEPYRVLVVANFPAAFSTEAARRLVSIAASGASCGVYTLVSVDTKQPMPQGFALVDLEQPSLVLDGRGGRFTWRDEDFEGYPLAMDAPPDAPTLRSALDVVGRKAKEAGRVEVDFEFIAPPADGWWTNDSRKGIAVPLGRAGATKRQVLQLGQGTSQHALVAGKTGSGKSTLLHALITNLALHYGPDEVELYLIDFKKGVEFKTYATHALPHARVVAVESEREFGLSVLQRLDAELKRRGDLFRVAGVQDVAGYRDSVRAATARERGLPRILLIVDEFQEFFVEDDRVSQEAALLLDRLVRQGRAFGLHVLLGSQTLGGAYSLARSTIDQMAVRIALQCSEADANLILSKDNNAARLLSRPGEAIYNDANGLLEGNDVFQVVWLPDERRERYLRRVQELADHRGWAAPSPMIVFEGNHPADITKNHLLRQALDGESRAARERVAWLGDALAIKDPTAAVFRRQSGSNLLIIGQQAEAARAVLTSGLIALAAQARPGEPAQFRILDGSTADDPQASWFGRLAKIVPDVRVAGPREVAPALAALAEELARRQADPDAAATPLFLAAYGLHRFRDLRKAEDDFGFGRRGEDKAATPAEQFGELLREGPAHGIHLLVWCDTLANTTRAVDRAGLREFDMRVLFQMGVNDSSTLIDSPLASRLGLHRALFASEEMATPEKFRPYSLPVEEWLEDVRKSFARRSSLVTT